MQSKSNNELIVLQGVGKAYGDTRVLTDVNATINRGDFVAITGQNGGGKTTLLRILLRLIEPSEGSVSYYADGAKTSSLRFGYLPQKNLIDSKFPITVEEVVTSGLNLGVLHRLSSDERELIDHTIERVGLTDVKRHSIEALSGGQLQRTLLARAIIGRPDVLVLDEPLSYIDKQFEQQFYAIVGDIAKEHTIVLVSHDMSTISQMATRHFIVNGSLHECTAHHHFVKTDCK